MQIEKLSTNIAGLDGLLDGGLPARRTTLVSGKSGTGKTSLALQLLANFAQAGLPGVFVSVEEHVEDVVQAAASMGCPLQAHIDEGHVVMLDLRPSADAQVDFSGDASVDGLVEHIVAAAEKVRAKVVVIDSISSLFQPELASAATRRHMFYLVQALERRGLTLVLTADAPVDYARPTTQGSEDTASLVLVLRNLVDDTRRRRTLEVYKYRRSNHRKGEYPYTISGDGVTLFPVELPASAYAREGIAGNERFSSGLEGLDTMTHGGLLRDAIVLVRGPAGSGKTTLAGMYALAGVERGETIAYYGFEEPRETLLRNYQTLGIQLGEHAEADLARIVCRYPEATSAEDLLIEMRRDLDQRKPSLVILDSISSIEHANSARAFRDFLIGLASLLRSERRSALLIQSVAPGHPSQRDAAPFLSSVADAILQLDYTSDAPTLERTMRVLKMRGSAHSLDEWQLRIASDGLHVDRPVTGADPER